MTYELRRTRHEFNKHGQLTGFPVNAYNIYSVLKEPKEIIEFHHTGELHEFKKNGTHKAIRKRLLKQIKKS